MRLLSLGLAVAVLGACNLQPEFALAAPIEVPLTLTEDAAVADLYALRPGPEKPSAYSRLRTG